MRVKHWIPLLIAASLAAPAPLRGSEFYEWIDENGVKHYATSLQEIPPKYRDQVKAPPSPPTKGKPAPPQPQPETAAAGAPAAPGAPAVPAASPQAADGRKLFEVPYEDEGTTSRIILPVTFNERVTVPVALDTGSPGLVISLGLAGQLGLLSERSGTLLIEAAGIGGSALAIRTIVDSVSVRDARSSFVPAVVTSSLSPAFEGLVGLDFLADYTVSIDTGRRIVTFEERAPDPKVRGGHDEAWWRRTFAQFREARDGWEGLKKVSASDGHRINPATVQIIDFQIREANELLMRLEGHASDHAVPREWR